MRHSLALPAFCFALTAFGLALLGCGTSARAQSPSLSAQDAWLRVTPGADVAAVYLTLHNAGTQAVTIVGVRSPRAQSAMIHQSSLVEGQSRMRPRERVVLDGGETLHFAPGGLHIMLQGLTRPLSAGEEVPIELLIEGGTAVAVTARVRALGAD